MYAAAGVIRFATRKKSATNAGLSRRTERRLKLEGIEDQPFALPRLSWSQTSSRPDPREDGVQRRWMDDRTKSSPACRASTVTDVFIAARMPPSCQSSRCDLQSGSVGGNARTYLRLRGYEPRCVFKECDSNSGRDRPLLRNGPVRSTQGAHPTSYIRVRSSVVISQSAPPKQQQKAEGKKGIAL